MSEGHDQAFYLGRGAPPFETLGVSPQNVVVVIDETTQVYATITTAAGPQDVTLSVEWSSDDESIATVDEDGLVTGTGVGSTVVRATFGSLTAGASVTVTGGSDVDDDLWFFVVPGY